VSALNQDPICTGVLPHSPAPIDMVVTVFGLILGLAVARTLPQLVSFYSWFSRSGLKIAEHRGYGQTACKMFGFIPAPKLSLVAMALSGVSFLALVLAPKRPPHLPPPRTRPRSRTYCGAAVTSAGRGGVEAEAQHLNLLRDY